MPKVTDIKQRFARMRKVFSVGTVVRIHRSNGDVAGKGTVVGYRDSNSVPFLFEVRVAAPGFDSDPIDSKGTFVKFGPSQEEGQHPVGFVRGGGGRGSVFRFLPE